VAVVEQPFANVRADETRAAGDQKIHSATLTTPAPAVENSQNEKKWFAAGNAFC
jgi:hypothetical protein